nr:MAG TPA: hypothetical protein [Caudoviricetes sp.]
MKKVPYEAATSIKGHNKYIIFIILERKEYVK